MLPPACRATPAFGSGHRAGIELDCRNSFLKWRIFYQATVGFRATCRNKIVAGYLPLSTEAPKYLGGLKYVPHKMLKKNHPNY